MTEDPSAYIHIVENEAEEYADFLQREGEELTVSVEGPNLSEEERAHAESKIQRAVVDEYRTIVEELTKTAVEELTAGDEGERAQGSRVGQALAHKNRWSYGEQPSDVPIIGLPLPEEGLQRIRHQVRRMREGLGLGGDVVVRVFSHAPPQTVAPVITPSTQMLDRIRTNPPGQTRTFFIAAPPNRLNHTFEMRVANTGLPTNQTNVRLFNRLPSRWPTEIRWRAIQVWNGHSNQWGQSATCANHPPGASAYVILRRDPRMSEWPGTLVFQRPGPLSWFGIWENMWQWDENSFWAIHGGYDIWYEYMSGPEAPS